VSAPADYPAASTRAAENLKVFDAVWNEINRFYYDPNFNGVDWAVAAKEFAPRAAAAVDQPTLYDVLEEMLDRLKDGHVGTTPPAKARDHQKQQITGIGIHFTQRKDRFFVVEVLPGGPAAKAGVQPGWAIISRDGVAPEKISSIPLKLGQVSQWIFEDPNGQKITLPLTAAEVSLVHREAKILPGNIAYIRFDEFDFDLVRWLDDQMKLYRDTAGLVLDLRENPGGAVIATMYALGHFVDRSQIVMVTLDREENRAREVPYTRKTPPYPGKLAVLVSEMSGSGSEVLAAAIQEQHRGLIVGRKTAGVVLASVEVGLPDGGLLQYSFCDLVTGRGARLEGVGVTPDLVTAETPETEKNTGRDFEIERAREALLTK
jgi:carboxyl-terminal processing protease